jgi:antitoxin PrlF
MSKATITSKGQLTIPKDVRDRLGLQTGDRLVFEIDGDSVRIRVERRRALEALRGSLPAKHRYPGKEGEREVARRHVTREVLEQGS